MGKNIFGNEKFHALLRSQKNQYDEIMYRNYFKIHDIADSPATSPLPRQYNSDENNDDSNFTKAIIKSCDDSLEQRPGVLNLDNLFYKQL